MASIKGLLACLMLFILMDTVFAFPIERRRDPFLYSFGYLVYPIYINLDPYGSAFGFGGTAIDVMDTDVDLTYFNIDGDFSASSASLLNLHIIPKTLIFDIGNFAFDVPSSQYYRGADSDPDDYYALEVNGKGYFGILTLSFLDRMIELYYRGIDTAYKIGNVRDKDDNKIENNDKSTFDRNYDHAGVLLDFTDDKQDPRKGIRLEYIHKHMKGREDYVSDFYVEDYSVSFYVPVLQYSTWAWNFYESHAVVTDEKSTTYDGLKKEIGLNCEKIPVDSNERSDCEKIEKQRIDSAILMNKHGQATAMGGTQRLRSYPANRFFAGHTRFYGTEFRWNLSDEHTPFNYIVMKSVRTGVQLAAFWEQGSVAETKSKLGEVVHTTYGVGVRLILEGTTVRLDYADGDEGSVVQIFIDYPWGLNAVDGSTR